MACEVINVTEVVAALIWDNDKFMICQRPAHKARGLLWEFVGGKVEPGESKDQALIRECREELAITLDVGYVFMDVTHEYPDITVHLTLFSAIMSALMLFFVLICRYIKQALLILLMDLEPMPLVTWNILNFLTKRFFIIFFQEQLYLVSTLKLISTH